ncbi:MAG: iron-containing alcohol dehydrogenase, partial [Gammaproteobacteria bacterium]|nr:iron-containing alcohol dehydrogenase [Gammaproteobacteria bacterium]
MNQFSIARLPRIEFGRGAFSKLPNIIDQFGQRVLLVTGAKSFQQSKHWEQLLADFRRLGFSYEHCLIDKEPSPHLVDEFVGEFFDGAFDIVVGIGGGSVLDGAKAIAGLLSLKHSVMEYL